MHNQIRILVIDDEKVIRDGCTRILSKDGYLLFLQRMARLDLPSSIKHRNLM